MCLVFSSPHYLLSFCKLSLSLSLTFAPSLSSISSFCFLSLLPSHFLSPSLSLSIYPSLPFDFYLFIPLPTFPPLSPISPSLAFSPSLSISLPPLHLSLSWVSVLCYVYKIYVMCIKLLITTNRIWKRFTAVYKYSLHGSKAVTYERCLGGRPRHTLTEYIHIWLVTFCAT